MQFLNQVLFLYNKNLCHELIGAAGCYDRLSIMSVLKVLEGREAQILLNPAPQNRLIWDIFWHEILFFFF